jgi:hypothetical protein
MDDALPIPGTRRRIGLDAILGLIVPGVGDAIAASSGLLLILLAFAMGVPGIVLVRMAVNVGVDALVGAIPLFGDVFDVGFKSNRMNVELIQRFARPDAKARPSDYILVIGSIVTVMLAVAAPLALTGWVVVKVVERFGG